MTNEDESVCRKCLHRNSP